MEQEKKRFQNYNEIIEFITNNHNRYFAVNSNTDMGVYVIPRDFSQDDDYSFTSMTSAQFLKLREDGRLKRIYVRKPRYMFSGSSIFELIR
jgi:hypothetical protein